MALLRLRGGPQGAIREEGEVTSAADSPDGRRDSRPDLHVS